MAAVSVDELQFAEIDFEWDIFEVERIRKFSWIPQPIHRGKKKKLNLKLVWKLDLIFDLTICTFVLNYAKTSPS